MYRPYHQGSSSPSVACFITNPTPIALASNPGVRGQKTVTGRLSYGAVAVAVNLNTFHCRPRAYLSIFDFVYAIGKVVEITPIQRYM